VGVLPHIVVLAIAAAPSVLVTPVCVFSRFDVSACLADNHSYLAPLVRQPFLHLGVADMGVVAAVVGVLVTAGLLVEEEAAVQDILSGQEYVGRPFGFLQQLPVSSPLS